MDGAQRPGNSQDPGRSVILPAGSACALAMICVLTACGELPLTEPSLPSQLEIRGTTLLMAGSRGNLTAWLPDGGQLREVPATWSADGDAISITGSGIEVGERVKIPDALVPADAKVEIEAKIAAGYFTDGSVPTEADLSRVLGRGLE